MMGDDQRLKRAEDLDMTRQRRSRFWIRFVYAGSFLVLLIVAALLVVNEMIKAEVQEPLDAYDTLISNYHAKHSELSGSQAYFGAYVAGDSANAALEFLVDEVDLLEYSRLSGLSDEEEQRKLQESFHSSHRFRDAILFLTECLEPHVQETFRVDQEEIAGAYKIAARSGVLYLSATEHDSGQYKFNPMIAIDTETWQDFALVCAGMMARQGNHEAAEALLLDIRKVLAPEKQMTLLDHAVCTALLKDYWSGVARLVTECGLVLTPILEAAIQRDLTEPARGLRAFDELLVGFLREGESHEELEFFDGLRLLFAGYWVSEDVSLDFLWQHYHVTQWWSVTRERAQTMTLAEIVADARSQSWWKDGEVGIFDSILSGTLVENCAALHVLELSALVARSDATLEIVRGRLAKLPDHVKHAWRDGMLYVTAESGRWEYLDFTAADVVAEPEKFDRDLYYVLDFSHLK